MQINQPRRCHQSVHRSRPTSKRCEGSPSYHRWDCSSPRPRLSCGSSFAFRFADCRQQLYVKIPSADRKTESTPDGTGIAHQGFSVRVEAEKEGEKELNKPYSPIKMNTLSSRSILLNPNNQVLFVLPESYARVAGLDCTNFSTMQSENIVKY
ncbi:hypothetical protein BLNAU_15907 [Blattamonas nauphoetae]|uniref:Uncharacterized protein n=1 Tax=Blattamonas nauphoetae TaxID=2049346 RepID=A0ABQ9XFZ0_9EUKA|nr:hypothetical protein BLNAU_15907 [Blattamonas nauphoetae]